MALTIEHLLANRRLGLRLVGGAAGLGRVITWAHAIELDDPTPWLEGGELIMTTGLSFAADDEGLRDYVGRLSAGGAGGLAVDTGTVFEAVPEAICQAGNALGFPVLAVAADVPFMAIGRAVAAALAADEVAAVKRVVDQQQRLAQAALTGGIPAVAEALAHALEARVLVIDVRGTILAFAGSSTSDEQAELLLERGRRRRRTSRTAYVDAHGQVISQPLGLAGVERGEVIVATAQALVAAQRLLISHAVSLMSMELEKPMKVLTVERRLRAGVLRALLGGGLGESFGELNYFGMSPDEPVMVLAITGVGPSLAAEELLERAVAEVGCPYLALTESGTAVVLLPADCPGDLPDRIVDTLRQALGRDARAGLGEPATARGAARSHRQAVAAATSGSAEVGGKAVRFAELSTYHLLLGGQSRETLEALAASALGPLETDDVRGRELIRTLEAFLANNGQWESAAADLGVHRHTMRNRMKRIVELLGRDMDSAHVRAELWLAVKARELLEVNADPGAVGLRPR